MKQLLKLYTTLAILCATNIQAQPKLTPELLEQHSFRFSLTPEGTLSPKASTQWKEWIHNNQFVGIAEVHNSAQLSYFTKALLEVLKEEGFRHFALEVGPHSASVLTEISSNSVEASSNIRAYNRMYGKKRKTPFVFVDKEEDALFVQEAARLNFNFWGLDQEYTFSFEMHLDQIHGLIKNPSTELVLAYQKAKTLVRKNVFNRKVKGQPTYCWYLNDETLNEYFDLVKNNEKAKVIIVDMRESWDIYCKSATGKGSNQQRANYMKKNFESYYAEADQVAPKVFLKLGGVHLTHGLSQFGVDDMGKYLTESVTNNEDGFLSIRHLIAHRNGKSNVGKKGWKSTSLFLEIGKKEEWTAVDLRPFRKMLEKGTIQVSKSIAFELKSYDILLISPDDQYPKVNY